MTPTDSDDRRKNYDDWCDPKADWREACFDLGRQPVNGEEGEASGSEERLEEAACPDSQAATAIIIRPGMKLYDEQGNFVGELGEPRKPFTEEDRQRTRERRQRHHTRREYEKQLLAVANGEVILTTQQYRALIAFGRVRGWNRRSPNKRPE